MKALKDFIEEKSAEYAERTWHYPPAELVEQWTQDYNDEHTARNSDIRSG